MLPDRAAAVRPERGVTDAGERVRRHRAGWLAVAGYVSAIFGSIPWVRSLSRALRAALGSSWALGALGVGFAVFVVARHVRALGRSDTATGRNWARIGVGAAAYAALVLELRASPDEVVHVAEYGILALLYARAFRAGESTATFWTALAATGLTGVLDELVQGITPGRVCDPRDMVTNVVAGALALWLARPEP